MTIKSKLPSEEDWARFVKDGLSMNQDTNVRYDFNKMTKLFGISYIYWLNAQFIMHRYNSLSLEELSMVEGGVPMRFWDRFRKKL